MPVSSSPVLVTGGTGFVASELVKQLLELGYRVRATTRDVSKARQSGELTSLPHADEHLELVAADLMDESSIEKAMDGVEYVMHVASPYVLTVDDPQRDLVDPAVNGTLAVMEAAAATPSVKRVVLTSSLVAIMTPGVDKTFDETDWCTNSSVDFTPYSHSKVAAEQAAWDFMEAGDRSFDLVVINPAGVIGPSVVRRVNETHTFFQSMTDGSTPAIIAFDFPAVDVRDVAKAHILAMENPDASGRYLLTSGNYTPEVMADIGRQTFGDKYKLPTMRLDKGIGIPISKAALWMQPKEVRDFLKPLIGKPVAANASRSRDDLGLEYMDLNESIADTWTYLDSEGFLGKQ